MKLDALLDPLRRMRLSASGIWDKLCAPAGREAVTPQQIDPQAVQRAVKEQWGADIDLKDAQQILDIAAVQTSAGSSDSDKLVTIMGSMIS
jgi:hypothetical protein